jgi:hypothetical protein
MDTMSHVRILPSARVMLALLLVGPLFASQGWSQDRAPTSGDRDSVWREFTARVHALHKKQLHGREIRVDKRTGGYMRHPDYYLEESFYDKATGVLLGRIQWERDRPDRIHVIEVFVHDDHQRVIRDYAAAYLPDYYKSFRVQDDSIPVHTMVNLHHHNGTLKAFRSFDASGDFLYESCRGRAGAANINISHDEDPRETTRIDRNSIIHLPVYQECFGALPHTAGNSLVPH